MRSHDRKGLAPHEAAPFAVGTDLVRSAVIPPFKSTTTRRVSASVLFDKAITARTLGKLKIDPGGVFVSGQSSSPLPLSESISVLGGVGAATASIMTLQ
jgi:hypothetical protein